MGKQSMNTTTKGLCRRCGTIKINRASGLKANWLLLVPALMMVTAAASAFAEILPASQDSSQIIQFLNQTVDWYRHLIPVQQTATEPGDFMLVSDNGRMANQVVRLAFDFARVEAEGIDKYGTSGADQNQGQKQSAGSPPLTHLHDDGHLCSGHPRVAEARGGTAACANSAVRNWNVLERKRGMRGL
jgi:hypothetical protein